MVARPLIGFIAAVLLVAHVGLAEKPATQLDIGPLPDGLGVNIHFTNARPGELEMLVDAGFKWVRMDFAWGAIEREKGKYDFSAYDQLMGALDKHHIRAVFILDYSNRFYDQDLSPHTEEGRTAFAKWAAASALHFKGRRIIWEMYNEPNISFWRPKPNPEDYAKLAIATGKAMREAVPEEIYIGPACSTMDFKFLETCFKAGCLEYWAAVSVHPYRQTNPETVTADYRRLRELIAKYAPAGKQIPIVSGEWGYSSSWNQFDPQKQGAYLPRELLVNVASGVPISIWYDWHEDGTDPHNGEHHFGIVGYEYHSGREPVYDPKPGYAAMKVLSEALSHGTFRKRLQIHNDADWVLLFKSDEGVRLAAWTTGPAHEVTIPASPGDFHGVASTGEKRVHRAGPDGLAVTLTNAPQYLFPSEANELLEKAARN